LDLNKQELQSRRLSAMRKIECPRWSPMRFSRIFKGKGQSWASRAVHVKPANCLHHIVSANKQASIETWERDWMMQCKNTTYTETCFISYKRNELLYKSADKKIYSRHRASTNEEQDGFYCLKWINQSAVNCSNYTVWKENQKWLTQPAS
jgi:hypothetical protein